MERPRYRPYIKNVVRVDKVQPGTQVTIFLARPLKDEDRIFRATVVEKRGTPQRGNPQVVVLREEWNTTNKPEFMYLGGGTTAYLN